MSSTELYLSGYMTYLAGFIILLVLPTETSRLYYLHLVSILVGLFANYEMKFYILLGMFHSAIHNLWPFLKNTGYDKEQTSVYDVFCHAVMMILCYHHIINVGGYITFNYVFHLASTIFIIGALINCTVSYFVTNNNNEYIHCAFEYTTIFQAISTGYWVATMLWYHNLENIKFYQHWIFWICIMTTNWFIYKFIPSLVGISMRYKYVEAVFIICTWRSGILSRLIQ
ncbi:hypothetical protein QJ854_gp101 [Moumouvirus goulette]|uniref:Uncharacterized protein n=1 Tax=Moumouvirus goulette TaxID=1247379 RepID=M1PNS5_9VIRU|nr:hypothetical protein QJ854_gp101 [Moumouvirus goulette]AGF85681.1 hypothetical protein glt_00878 [Moumouvirus goulette]